MPISLPPWLQPINPVPYYMEGISQGSSIAERQNSAERAIQEMTMRREAQQRQQEAQELATAHTLQQMAIAKQASDQKAAEAAMKWQGQQEYQSLINAGKTPEEAFTATAHKLMPSGLWHVASMAESRRNQEENRALREREVTARERSAKAAEDRQNIKPEITTVIDPLTGEEHSIFRTGPNTYHPLPTEKTTGEQKKLTGIEERDLISQQRELEKDLVKARKEGNASQVEKTTADLLKNKTAQSNLVMAASQKRKYKTVNPEELYWPGNNTGLTAPPSDSKKAEEIHHISTKEDYDSLPSGSIYIDEQTGQKGRKP